MIRLLWELVAAVSTIGCLLIGLYLGLFQKDYAQGTWYLAVALTAKVGRDK